MKLKMAVALVTLPSALLLTAAPAFADGSSDGTVHYNVPQTCYDFYGYYGYGTFCYSSSAQWNVTTAPSGNESDVAKGTYFYSFTSPGYSYIDTEDYQTHSLFKEGEYQVYSDKVSGSFPYLGQTCTFTDAYHYANGAVQFDRPDLNCA